MEKVTALAGIKKLLKNIVDCASFPIPAFMRETKLKAEEFNAQYKPLFFMLVQKYGPSAVDHMIAGYRKAGQDPAYLKGGKDSYQVILDLMRESVNAPDGARIFCGDCQKTTSHEIHWHNGGIYEGHVWRCRYCKKHGAWLND
jgi:hypothetical protein